MSEIARTIAAIKKRQLRGTSTIADALLGIAPYRYIVHRLKYYTANRLYLVGLHITEFMILIRMMPYQSLGEVIVFVHGLSLVTAFFWGVLEGQRREVYEARTPLAKSQVLDDWFTTAVSLCFGLVVTWLLLIFYFGFGEFVVEIGTVFLMRGCFDLLSRCRYSGLFTFQRVYRPFPIIVALESLGILSAAAAVFLFHTEGFAIFLGAAAVLTFSVEWSFASRDYERLRIRTPKFRAKFLLQIPKGLLRSSSLAHGLYMVSHKASSLCVLLASYHADSGALPLVFHLVSPVFNMAANWVHSLYFDFRKYRVSIFQKFLSGFSKSVLFVSFGYGLLCAGLGAFLVRTLITWQAHTLIPYLGALIISRAVSGAVVTSKFNHSTVLVPLLANLLTIGIPAAVLCMAVEIEDSQIMTWLIAGQLSMAFLLLLPVNTPGLAAVYAVKRFRSVRLFFCGQPNSKESQWLEVDLDRTVLRRIPLEERLERSSGVLAYLFLRGDHLLLRVSAQMSLQNLRMLLGGCARSMKPLTEKERNQLRLDQMPLHTGKGTLPRGFEEVATFPAQNKTPGEFLRRHDISAYEVLNASRQSFEGGRPRRIKGGYHALAVPASGYVEKIMVLKFKTQTKLGNYIGAKT